jgi:hypothetical protein
MTIAEENHEYELDPGWLRNHGWKVMPVEDGNHFAPDDIALIVLALKKAGYSECVVAATEPLGPLSVFYSVLITEDDFRNFNAECGLFRYLLTVEDRSWAISCNEWYNLFAGNPEMLEAMLGRSIEQARQDYLRFVLR